MSPAFKLFIDQIWPIFMKHKYDNKTQSLDLAKTNAERQNEFRQRIKKSGQLKRINNFISIDANDQLQAFMKGNALKQKNALSLILESLKDPHINDLVKKFINN